MNAADGENGGDGGYEFGDSRYPKRYGAGGGGGHGHNGEIDYRSYYGNAIAYPGQAGSTGAGCGNNQYRGGNCHNAAANTGGGGGGASYVLDPVVYNGWSSDGYTSVTGTEYPAGTGGSGIVIIRNKR